MVAESGRATTDRGRPAGGLGYTPRERHRLMPFTEGVGTFSRRTPMADSGTSDCRLE